MIPQLKNRIIPIILTCMIFTGFASAAETILSPVLTLKGIKQISKQESRDEIYLLVSDLDAKSHQFYTVPGHDAFLKLTQAPHHSVAKVLLMRPHWYANKLAQIQNIQIWSRPLANQEGTQLIVSLIESDVPPWNLDDSLGSVKLDIMNQNQQFAIKFEPYSHAQLISQKKLPNGQINTILIKNDKAEYLITLEITTQDVSKDNS